MREFYRLLNERIPEEQWIGVAKSQCGGKVLQFNEREILANADEAGDLRNFIGCIIALLVEGREYGKDFRISRLSSSDLQAVY